MKVIKIAKYDIIDLNGEELSIIESALFKYSSINHISREIIKISESIRKEINKIYK